MIDEVSSIRLMTFLLIIPTGLFLIWSVVSLLCRAQLSVDAVDGVSEPSSSSMSTMFVTMFGSSSPSWLFLWYFLWFVWFSSSVSLSFVGDFSTLKMLGLFGNAFLSLMWWVMIMEYSRGPFRGFTCRRIVSLLSHRVLLLVWSVSLYVVCVSASDDVTWYLSFVAWCFVSFLAVVWELFFVRHLTRVDETSSWFPG